MGSFKLGKMTLGSIFKKPETIQYPAQTRYAPPGLKGHIVNDIDACILCGICMKRCPTGALVVDKPAGTWSIDRFRCVQCGSCVRECPKHCLSMDPAYAPPATKKSIDVVSKEMATDGRNDAKEAE
ncbi:4Fe-4S dicluster domain-containing protein [Raoultibacter massiliensis]|uniref:4Fe-4S dicluster domain-containing protein n=1 Tax=Raoultibacter massiliensis TaxID=1852371 RepID=A0ABV1JAT3_9ACTN|nr:4Fe-4S dicluster domain-containing protein [Raoultibacter massiliensis]